MPVRPIDLVDVLVYLVVLGVFTQFLLLPGSKSSCSQWSISPSGQWCGWAISSG